MWVRLYEWMIMDGEPPLPVTGTVLTRVGIRMNGMLSDADPNGTIGVHVVHATDNADPPHIEYSLTGVASGVRDVEADTGAGGMTHARAEFVLVVDDDLFQIHFDGPARAISPGSRVTVTGTLSLVGGYEWDAFQLSDTRGDWLVKAVVDVGSGDAMLDLTHPAKQ